MVIWPIKIFRWVHPPGPVRDVEVELGKTHSQVVKRVGRYSILEDVKKKYILKVRSLHCDNKHVFCGQENQVVGVHCVVNGR